MFELLKIRNLSTYYYTMFGVVKAVEDFSLDVKKNEWISLVGESGSGKSTIAYSIMNLVPPPGRIVKGEILFDGIDLTKIGGEEMRRIRGEKIGMIFQDPMTSLDPLRKVGDQMTEAMVEHGVPKDEARGRAEEYIERIGIPKDRLNYYPHELSGGQRQRIMIATAMMLNPKLLIADEPTTSLDVIVQESIMDLLSSLKKMGASILLVTHDISLAADRSDGIAVVYAGRLLEYGRVSDVIGNSLHPYTKMLLSSVPDIWGAKKIRYIPGFPPNLRNPPSGCRFHPRCPSKLDKCDREAPPMVEVKEGHYVSCWLYVKDGDAVA